jgi:hypothetical protein
VACDLRKFAMKMMISDTVAKSGREVAPPRNAPGWAEEHQGEITTPSWANSILGHLGGHHWPGPTKGDHPRIPLGAEFS